MCVDFKMSDTIRSVDYLSAECIEFECQEIETNCRVPVLAYVCSYVIENIYILEINDRFIHIGRV